VPLLLAGFAIGFVLVSLLAGWPMAQSLSADFVSPLRMLKATRGHRSSLILLGVAIGGIGRADFVPDISKANNVGEAVLMAVTDGFVQLVVLGLTAAIAAAAWQFAARQDETLNPS
jgi:hypothetical protein